MLGKSSIARNEGTVGIGTIVVNGLQSTIHEQLRATIQFRLEAAHTRRQWGSFYERFPRELLTIEYAMTPLGISLTVDPAFVQENQ